MDIWAYPRTGGETILAALNAEQEAGLSPHGRGNQTGVALTVSVPGPIPRTGRGNRLRGS